MIFVNFWQNAPIFCISSITKHVFGATSIAFCPTVIVAFNITTLFGKTCTKLARSRSRLLKQLVSFSWCRCVCRFFCLFVVVVVSFCALVQSLVISFEWPFYLFLSLLLALYFYSNSFNQIVVVVFVHRLCALYEFVK